MKVPQMPNEVLSMIMDELATPSLLEYSEQAERERDLAVCARTARVLHRNAMARLYENFDLEFHVRGGFPQWQREDIDMQGLEVRLGSKSSTKSFNLAMHPYLGKYIQKLDINIAYHPPDNLEYLVVATAVAHVLAVAPNVRSLFISTTYYDDWNIDMEFLSPVLDVINARCADLRTLQLAFITTSHREFSSQNVTYPLALPFIRSFRHLHSLVLRNFHIDAEDVDVSVPVPFSLRHLVFEARGSGARPVFDWITSRSQQSLEAVEFDGFVTFDISPLVRLHKIQFTLALSFRGRFPAPHDGLAGFERAAIESATAVSATIKSARPGLKCVTIFDRAGEYPVSAFDASFFASFPRTISLLVLHGVRVDQEALLNILVGQSGDPRTINVVGCTQSRLEVAVPHAWVDGFLQAEFKRHGMHFLPFPS